MTATLHLCASIVPELSNLYLLSTGTIDAAKELSSVDPVTALGIAADGLSLLHFHSLQQLWQWEWLSGIIPKSSLLMSESSVWLSCLRES